MSLGPDDLNDTAGKHLEKLLGAIREGSPGGLVPPTPAPQASTEPGPVGPIPPPALAAPRSGAIIRDTWELSELVGKGGFGLVFTARHKTLGRQDALKFLHPHLADDVELRERFAREAMVMARLRGEHLVNVLDYGEHEDLPFFAMEWLEGQTLDERLSGEEPVPLDEFFELADAILHGLAEIHAHGIVHRDIKPANIFILSHGGRIKMLDFGLAMTSMRVTAQGAILGTPIYMAPELLVSPDTEASVRTDLYSAGLVLYQMLTGRLPFSPDKDGSLAGFLQQVITVIPPAPSSDRPQIPEALDQLVLRALDKEPAMRPETAQELLEELGAVRTSLAASRAEGPDATAEEPRPKTDASPTHVWLARPARSMRLMVAGLGLLLTAAAVVAWLWWPWASAPVFAQTDGLVVTAPMWASSEVVGRYESLCEALRAVAPRRVRCARVSRWDAEPARYRRWLTYSKAALGVHVDDADVARLVPDDVLAQLPVFGVLPPIDLHEPGQFDSIASLVAVLPRIAEPGGFAVPRVDVERAGYRWATIAALVRRLHSVDVTQESVAELRRLAKCEGVRRTVDLDLRLCDIAQYLEASLELEHPQTCPRLVPLLRRLVDDPDPTIANLGRLSLAGCIAADQPAEAASQALEALAHYPSQQSCALVSVIPLIPHMNAQSAPERELISRVASFDPQGCLGAADAFARSAKVHRTRQQHQYAAKDLYSAYRLEPNNRRYLVAWAETLMREPLSGPSRALLQAELRRDLFVDPVPPAELSLALSVAYLRWLVTRDVTDARELLTLHAALPDGQRPLLKGACSELRSLACPDDAASCSLDLLQAPKITTSQTDELAASLGIPSPG